MKRTTRKLSGPAKDRFLARFIAEEPGLAADIADRLTERCRSAFTSLRIRRSIKLASRPPRAPIVKASPTPAASLPASPVTSAAQQPPPPTSSPAGGAAAAAFDPYVFGLVPVFQREGRDGLLERLAGIERAADLRAMAKTQQVVLPQELRSGDASAAVLRAAIVEAVAKRIADRKAAAG